MDPQARGEGCSSRELNVAAKITFNAVVAFDRVADLADVVLVEVVALLVGRDTRSIENDVGRVTAETVDVRECDLDALVAREVDAGDASHDLVPLTLALLVARVGADDANDALALDDLALGTDRFDGCSNFHGSLLLAEVI